MNNLLEDANLLLSKLNELELWYKRMIEKTNFYQYMPRKRADHETSYWPSRIDFEPRIMMDSRLITITEAFKTAKKIFRSCKRNKFRKDSLEEFFTIMRNIFSGIQMKEELEQNIKVIKRQKQLTTTEKAQRIQNKVREYTFSYAPYEKGTIRREIKRTIDPITPKDTILKEIKKTIDPSKPIKSKKEEAKYVEWYKKIEYEIAVRKEELRALLERTCNFMDFVPSYEDTSIPVPEMSSFLVTLAQQDLTERYIYALEAIKAQIDLKRLRTIRLDEKLFYSTLLENERQIYVAEQKLKQIQDVKETTRIRETLKENLVKLRKQVKEGERILLQA